MAKDKAKEAAYIQSGVSHKVDLARLRLEEEAYIIARRTHTEMLLGGTIYVAKTYRDKKATIPIGSGNKMYLQQNSIGVELRIP